MARAYYAVVGGLVAILAMGACREDPSLGALGTACNASAQCRGSMVCEPTHDEFGGRNPESQCLATCQDDGDCSRYGAAKCVDRVLTNTDGAVQMDRICVAACEENLDCVVGGVCNVDGWCSRDQLPDDTNGGGNGGANANGAGNADANGTTNGAGNADANNGGGADASNGGANDAGNGASADAGDGG
jgi:hypothetical protein